MKKILLFLLSILFLSSTYAQNNVNVDNYRFNFTYRALPSKPLNPMFFYYKAFVNAPATVTQVVDTNLLLDKIKIDGQRKTDELKPGDIQVVLNMGTLNILSTEVNERIEELKDKDGKITGRNYYYSLSVSYNFEASATITKDEEKINSLGLYNRISPMKYVSKEFGSSREASEYWKNNRENLVETFTRNVTEGAVNNLSSNLTNLYGFPTVKTTDIIKTINEKKHPENDPLRAASDKLKGKLEAMDANTPMVEGDVADLIDYFKGILTRYTDPKLKADVRLRYVALYNLCKIYLYLDQPEKVQEYADEIFTNGHDKGDAKKMNENADKLMLLFNSSNEIKTRHFDPDAFFAE